MSGLRAFIQCHSTLQRMKSFPKNYQEMWLCLWIIYSNINLCSCISSKFQLFVCDYTFRKKKKNHLGILTQILVAFKLTFIKLINRTLLLMLKSVVRHDVPWCLLNETLKIAPAYQNPLWLSSDYSGNSPLASTHTRDKILAKEINLHSPLGWRWYGL